MEAAFGLSVTLTMLMTTILLANYLYARHAPRIFTFGMLAVYSWIEITFLVANMKKFMHGGWLTLLIGLTLVTIMYIWHSGRTLKHMYRKYLRLGGYIPTLQQLSTDASIPKFATHVVYLTQADSPDTIEQRIVESIFCEQPKRADIYWLIHVHVDDAPYTMSYSTKIIAPQDLVFIRFKLGFRVVPRINLFFEQIVDEMIANREVTIHKNYCMIGDHGHCGDFRFIVLKSFLSFENELPFWKNLMMRLYFILDKLSIADTEAFGLDYNNVVTERVPLIVHERQKVNLKREME
jgi:KUP system potassium uptake protein